MSSNFNYYHIYYKPTTDISYIYYDSSSSSLITIKDLSQNTQYNFRIYPYSTISNLSGDYIDISGITDISLNWTDYSTVSTTNLSLYYPFSSNIYNYATYAEDAVVYNGSSIINGSLKITSSSSSNIQYIKLPSFINTTNGMTFSFWIKYSSAENWARIFDFGNGAYNNNVYISFIGGLPIVYGGHGTNYNTTGKNFGLFYPDEWIHVSQTITYTTMSGSTTNCYINGNKTLSDFVSGYPEIIKRTKNYIGLNNDGNNNGYFNSVNIAEFRYYDRTLTDEEISILATYGKPEI